MVQWAGKQSGLVPGISGVISLAPCCDLQLCNVLQLGANAVLDFLGTTPELRPDTDPAQLVCPLPDCPPVTIVHGECDSIVPVGVSVAYGAKFPTTNLVRVPLAGHFEVIDPRKPAFLTVLQALAQFTL